MTGGAWASEYRKVLNRRLDGVCLCALAGADSPDVMRSLREPVIGFSGGVLLAFEEDADLFLTWDWTESKTSDYGLALYPSETERWRRFALDRIRVSAEDPWGRLADAVLRRVDIYSSEGTNGERLTTTAAHHLEGPSGPVTFWVSTASGEMAGEGDDILVSIDRDLAAASDFHLDETIQ